jgi:CxxC-x17-CxxC domain-containing protein
MKNFKSGNRPERRDSYKKDYENRSRREITLYDAVCDQCGKNCQVPFRPSGNKPVYCSDCFEQRGGKEGRSDRSGSQRRSFDREDQTRLQNNTNDAATIKLTEKIGVLNNKLDTIISILSTSEAKKIEPEKKVKKPKKLKSVKK